MSGYTQEQLDALREAVSKGVLTAKMGEEQITYRSQNEMLSLIAVIERALKPSGSVSRQHYPSFSRGT